MTETGLSFEQRTEAVVRRNASEAAGIVTAVLNSANKNENEEGREGYGEAVAAAAKIRANRRAKKVFSRISNFIRPR